MHWEAVLVSCRHLVKFLFYTHFSTENRIFEGSFLPHSLRLCPASLPAWFPKNLVSFLAWVKSLACRQLPPNQDIDFTKQRNQSLIKLTHRLYARTRKSKRSPSYSLWPPVMLVIEFRLWWVEISYIVKSSFL